MGTKTRNSQRGRLLSVTEAAEMANVNVRMIRRLKDERRIPFYKVGRHVRIAEDDLRDFIEAGRVEAIR